MGSAEVVLEFWLGSASGATPSPELRRRWFQKDPAFDHQLTERFGALHEAAAAGRLNGWMHAPRSGLALTLVLDQFSRNLFRNTPGAFAHDAAAIACTDTLIGRGDLGSLAPFECFFALMPLMHAEDPARQADCVRHLQKLHDSSPRALQPELASSLEYARRHQEIIDRFGRFPHRNAILGRSSTPEELEFLKEPGSSF